MEFRSSFEEESSMRKLGKRQNNNEETRGFKSKNLLAERRRRQKLKDRLLGLRGLVPIITNMKKETIIEDSITYIIKLKNTLKDLTDQLKEMEMSSEEEEVAPKRTVETNNAEEMKKSGIEEGVELTSIDGKKLWVKIVLEKKTGGLTKLLNAMSYFGFEFTDTSVTTSKGAMVISSCAELQGIHGKMHEVERIRELLMEIVTTI